MRSHRPFPPLLLCGLLAVLAGCHNYAPPPPPPPPPPMAPPPPPPMPAGMYRTEAEADAGRPARGDTAGFNTEEYRLIEENPFRDVRANPLSTFAIDVDAASYSNVRRFLRERRLPPRDAVRIEELINYFDYDYPDPTGEHPFSINTEVSAAPWNPEHRLVQVGLQGRRMERSELPPGNLVFLIDVSGSMQSADKLPLVKESLRMLVSQLRREDRVSIVVYAGAAGLVLPSTPGNDRRRILDAIDRLEAGGSTAGGQGIVLAYETARESFIEGGNNRVILATDGDFNVGVSSESGLVQLIEQKRETGIFLTVLGFGTGNLADARMEQLADHGNGNYAYVDGQAEARKVLVREMGGTLVTIAKDVKVQVEFNPARVRAYRLIGYENRVMAAEDFNNDRKDGGELGAGHSVTALYEIVPVGVDTPVPGADPLRYQQVQPRPGAAASDELLTVKLRYKAPEGESSWLIEQPVRDRGLALDRTSDDFRFAAAVAQWGMLLRDSQFKGSSTWSTAADLAGGALGHDEHGYRAEFVRLLDESRRLAETQRPADASTTGGRQ